MDPRPRVLLICPFYPGALGVSFARAFESLGVDVVRFDSDRAYLAAGRFARHRPLRRLLRRILWDRMNRSLIEAAKTARPSILVVLKGPFIDARTIVALRSELGVPFVNFYPDNPLCGVPLDPRKTSAQRHDLVDVLRHYDKVFIWGRAMRDRLAAEGITSYRLPFAVDPAMFHADGGEPSEPPCGCGAAHDVVFVGQHSPKREQHVGAIKGVSAALWGARWSRARASLRQHVIHEAPIFGDQCGPVYRRAAVSLNIVDDLNMPGHNMRTFEIPASGGIMVSTFTEEQAEFFPEDEAAVYYRDAAELDEKIARVTRDAALQQRLRRNALAISRRHTYRDRVSLLLREAGLTVAS